MLVFTNAQGVESSTKDAVHEKNGREEEMTSLIGIMRSSIISKIATLTKADPDSINRKRRNESSRYSFENKCRIKNMLNHILAFFPLAPSEGELSYCRDLIIKDDHHKKVRLQRFENSYEIGQSNPREENQRQQISGVTYTPLLLGSVQFGLLASLCLPLTCRELQIRECVFCTHEVDYFGEKTLNGTTALLKTLKKHEHPTHDDATIVHSKEDVLAFECFAPRFLDAVAWHPDNVNNLITIHCTIEVHIPHQISSVPPGHFLFKNMRKNHYNHVFFELQARNVSFERIKLNSKGKSSKVGVKALASVLRKYVCPNEEHDKQRTNKNEHAKFESFLPTCLSVREWTDLPLNPNPNDEQM